MHKILIYLHIIHLLKSSTCFENYPAHFQVHVVFVYKLPLVSSLSAGDCLVHRLRKNSAGDCLVHRLRKNLYYDARSTNHQDSFIFVSSSPICCLIVTFPILSFLDILEDLLRASISVASTRLLLFSASLHISLCSFRHEYR